MSGNPDYREIPLTKGYKAIVDLADYEWCATHRWHARVDRNNVYALRSLNPGKVLMHRVILNAPSDTLVDHINHNGLDNRRINLRLCTNRQNQFNKKKTLGKSSQYKGVYWNALNDRWVARLILEGNIMYLGNYCEERDAAMAYDAAANRYFGEFAKLNLIELKG